MQAKHELCILPEMDVLFSKINCTAASAIGAPKPLELHDVGLGSDQRGVQSGVHELRPLRRSKPGTCLCIIHLCLQNIRNKCESFFRKVS
jgi:hypothetical protein